MTDLLGCHHLNTPFDASGALDWQWEGLLRTARTMVTRKRFLKFYTGDHKRVRDQALPDAFYAVETVVHSKAADVDHHVTEERIVWLLSDPAIRVGLPTMSAVRRWINAKWKTHRSANHPLP